MRAHSTGKNWFFAKMDSFLPNFDFGFENLMQQNIIINQQDEDMKERDLTTLNEEEKTSAGRFTTLSGNDRNKLLEDSEAKSTKWVVNLFEGKTKF